jgi:hypothetical protein
VAPLVLDMMVEKVDMLLAEVVVVLVQRQIRVGKAVMVAMAT